MGEAGKEVKYNYIHLDDYQGVFLPNNSGNKPRLDPEDAFYRSGKGTGGFMNGS